MQLQKSINPKLSLSPYHLERIKAIDGHDFSGVVRKTRNDLALLQISHQPEWFERGVLALKQYYAVALLDGNNMHAVSNRVDPFWHAHILHTQDYHRFCDAVVGGYMHHDPLDHEIKVAVEHVSRLYDFTRSRYDEFFSHIDDEFNPRHLESSEVICVHFGTSYDAAKHSLFPADPSAQPTIPLH